MLLPLSKTLLSSTPQALVPPPPTSSPRTPAPPISTVQTLPLARLTMCSLGLEEDSVVKWMTTLILQIPNGPLPPALLIQTLSLLTVATTLWLVSVLPLRCINSQLLLPPDHSYLSQTLPASLNGHSVMPVASSTLPLPP